MYCRSKKQNQTESRFTESDFYSELPEVKEPTNTEWFFPKKFVDVPEDSLNFMSRPMAIDRVGQAAYTERKVNGFRLFGKYYECMWD